jgi:hypothetical protein
MHDHGSTHEDSILAAIREIQSLSRMPSPVFRAPPWEKIRAALPPGIMLPMEPVHVLVDLDIDATGTVVHAAVGRVAPSLAARSTVAACVSAAGGLTVQAPLDSADAAVAQAVAAGFVGAKFTPGERDGQPVPVRQFRMGIAVSSAVVGSRAVL